MPPDAAARVLAADLPSATVIGGADDILVGRTPTHAYAEAIGAGLVELGACDHHPWVERPDAFRTALRDALTR